MRLRRLLSRLLIIVLLGGLGLTASSAAPLTAATPVITLVAPANPQPATGTIDVEIRVVQASKLGAWELDIAFDPALVAIGDLILDPAFGATEAACRPDNQRCAIALGPIVDGSTGSIGAVSYGKGDGLTGEATLAVLRLIPTGAAGTVALQPGNALITSVDATPMTPAAEGAMFTLAGEQELLYLPAVAGAANAQETQTEQRLHLPGVSR